MRKTFGLCSAVVCMVVLMVSASFESKAATTTTGERKSLSWQWYRSLRDTMDKYVAEETAPTKVVTDYQLRVNGNSFSVFIANFCTGGSGQKVGYRYYSSTDKAYKDVVIWDKSNNDDNVNDLFDYEAFKKNSDGTWSSLGTFTDETALGASITGFSGGQTQTYGYGESDHTYSWSKFKATVNEAGKDTCDYKFNITAVKPMVYKVTLPEDAANKIVQLFIQRDSKISYSMSSMNTGDNVYSNCTSAFEAEHATGKYLFFGFEDWLDNKGLKDLNDIVLGVFADEVSLAPTLIDNSKAAIGEQTVTNSVKTVNDTFSNTFNDVLFYGTTFHATLPTVAEGKYAWCRVQIVDASGKVIYTSGMKLATANGDGTYEGLPGGLYVAYDIDKIQGCKYKVQVLTVDNNDTEINYNDWSGAAESDLQAINNSAVTPKISITRAQALATTPSSTDLTALVNWEATCEDLPAATKAMDYKLTVTEDQNVTDNTASAKLRARGSNSETANTRDVISMGLTEAYGENQKETLDYHLIGNFYTAKVLNETVLSDVTTGDSYITDGTGNYSQLTTEITCDDKTAVFTTTDATAETTANSSDNTIKSNTQYYGSNFTVNFDKDKYLNSTCYVRLSFVNVKTGEVVYVSNVAKATSADNFVKVSDPGTPKTSYTTEAFYNINDIEDYVWNYEVIYVKGTSDADKISATDAASYDVVETGFSLIDNAPIDLNANFTVPRYHYVKSTLETGADYDYASDMTVAFSKDYSPIVKVNSISASSKSNVNNSNVVSGDATTYDEKTQAYNYSNKAIASATLVNGDTVRVDFNLNYSYNESGPKDYAFVDYSSVAAATTFSDKWTVNTVSKSANDYSIWVAPVGMGLASRVTTNYFNSNNDYRNATTGALEYREYSFNDLCTRSIYEKTYDASKKTKLLFLEGRAPSATINFMENLTLEQALTDKLSTTITYPAAAASFAKYGLTLTATVCSDKNSYSDYNAIVVARVKDGDYLINGKGNYEYYVLNGAKQGFSSISKIVEESAAGVAYQWYTTDGASSAAAVDGTVATANGTVIPGLVDGLTFDLSDQASNYTIEVYVVSGNELRSIEDLVNNSTQQYAVKFSHNFNADNTATGITDINADGTAANKEVKSVVYYNAAGVAFDAPVNGFNIKVTTYTDGTTESVKVIR